MEPFDDPYYYHVAPREHRQSIEQHGIRASDPTQGNWRHEDLVADQKPGAYLFKNREHADYWAWENMPPDSYDLWAVDPSKLQLQEDPMMSYPSAYSTTDIPPTSIGREPSQQEMDEEHFARVASVTRPLYYRWVYSPSKGVTVNNNHGTHPALVKYHGDLASDINDTDLSHGFASHIGNGWRITDLAHKPVEDPYIVSQVVRKLNLEDGPQMRSEGAWQPAEYDFERLHYGLPCESAGH